MFFTYDTPTISEFALERTSGQQFVVTHMMPWVDTLPKINYFYLGSIFLVTQHLIFVLRLWTKILDKFKLAKVRNTTGTGSNK